MSMFIGLVSTEAHQGSCQVALDGGNVFIAGGRQFIDAKFVDLKSGVVIRKLYSCSTKANMPNCLFSIHISPSQRMEKVAKHAPS